MGHCEHNFTNTVLKYIQAQNLLYTDGLYIVALSGGADSVALLHALHALGIKTEAAHCNFHLRGEESIRDEHFCKKLCQQMNIPFHVVHFDTTSFAKLHHISIEMAARQLRYTYFHQLRIDMHAQGICVAHHRDDSVETVLLNLVRGTGLHGLRGILPHQGEIIRPLLCVTRKDIEKYLQDMQQDHVTDSTNLVNDVKRNKIRLNVIPLLETLNPDVKSSIFTTSSHIIEACKFFDAAMECAIADVENDNKINIDKLKRQSSAEYVLFIILKQYGFTSKQIQEISTAILREKTPQGKIWESHTHEILADRGYLVIEWKGNNIFPEMRIPVEGVYVLHASQSKIQISHFKREEITSFVTDKSRIYVDAQKTSFPLHLRTVKKGDRFIPFGMKQSKLVSNYLTDRKLSLFEKRRQLVLTTDKDEIVWIVGERGDNRFRVTQNTTDVTEIALL